MNNLRKVFSRANEFLDRYVLPWPVRFLTFRFVILLTICLLIPLLVFAKHTTLVLGINSYLNTMSVAVSSIVLLYATIAEVRQNQIAQLQEKRAQEDHQHVTEMHNLILQALHNQDVELDELKKLMAAMSGKEIILEEHAQPADMRSLHPRGADRFADNDLNQRMQKDIHHNALTSTIRKGLSAQDNE